MAKLSPSGVFTSRDAAAIIDPPANIRHALTKRAMARGDIIQICRGLYCLNNDFQRTKPNPLSIAQLIYGPSYISLESALRWHNWIPESVYQFTSVSCKRAREFDTPLGHFSYACVPQHILFAGVDRKVVDESIFLIASPLKALADYVYVHKCNWPGIDPVVESLRVESTELDQLTGDDFDIVAGNYNSSRVNKFLIGLRKDLKL